VEDAYGAASREVGLTSQQAQLLCLSRRAGPIGELAHALRCDRSNISRMVDRAEGKGLVERRAHASDGRLAVVGLTARGEQTMRRFIATLDAHLQHHVSDWPADRRQIALEVLDDLAGALEAAGPPADARTRPSAVASLRGI
jgi:DNA-binding MarR family transcriptional regulator